MAIIENSDYVFCPKATYIGAIGIGKGCLVGTRSYLLGLPEQIESAVFNRSITTTTYSIAGLAPGDAIQTIAQAGDTDLAGFEGILTNLGANAEGAVFVDLSQQLRLKVRAGLLSKGVYWSDRNKGPGWKGYGLGPKSIAQTWVAFYEGHPIAV